MLTECFFLRTVPQLEVPVVFMYSVALEGRLSYSSTIWSLCWKHVLFDTLVEVISRVFEVFESAHIFATRHIHDSCWTRVRISLSLESLVGLLNNLIVVIIRRKLLLLLLIILLYLLLLLLLLQLLLLQVILLLVGTG